MNVRRAGIEAGVISVVLFALCVLVAPAKANPPGPNGLISFRRYFNDEHTSGALFVINPDGTHETQITFPGPNELDYTQSWSPDGRQLVYEKDIFTPGCDECERSEIWVVNVDGSDPHRVFPFAGDDTCLAAGDPSWSPDGQWLAFELVRGPVTNDLAAEVSIWAIHPRRVRPPSDHPPDRVPALGGR